MKCKSIYGAVVAGLLMMAPAYASSDYPSLYERAKQEGKFNTFLEAAQAADLAKALQDETATWTILAPTDDAFARLPADTLERLLKPENKQELVMILKGHIIPGKVYASAWANEKASVKTEAGSSVVIDGSGNPFKVNNADIVTLNVTADNGMIHVIDEVLLPPSS